jgi:glycosyltransferase involved in cell wall biosynthesis
MEIRKHAELVGPVPRTEMGEHFGWAPVFALPSICEGPATVTYEALPRGLPVVCTPNTGSVVRDGIDGYIVPPRDTGSLVARLDMLAGDSRLLAQMSANALAHASEFTVGRYGQRLLAALTP